MAEPGHSPAASFVEARPPWYVDALFDHGDERQRPGAAAFSATEAVQLFVRMHQLDCLKVVYLGFEKARASLP